MNNYEPNEGDMVVYSDLHHFGVWRGDTWVYFYAHDTQEFVCKNQDQHIMDYDDAVMFAHDISEDD